MHFILAVSLLSVVYVTLVIPILGSVFTGRGADYKEDWCVGFAIHLVIMVLFASVGSVLWALMVITGG